MHHCMKRKGNYLHICILLALFSSTFTIFVKVYGCFLQRMLVEATICIP